MGKQVANLSKLLQPWELSAGTEIKANRRAELQLSRLYLLPTLSPQSGETWGNSRKLLYVTHTAESSFQTQP
jgi:hypothetical protein